ncbi:PREDICTED: UPF0481 protein At3g47200-like [Populus euphratica]|uniref:UPF0481 protein At3g47200-like n=1 Tax=Populus euphratica TaxID=75702 RepID=A0AAJ6T451_POPEU|nr:PREDICTED: UPF0481 protein At3g47200-like [Populus euphratica]
MEKSERDGGTRNVDVCGPFHGVDDQVTVDIDSLTSSVESMMSQNLMMSDKACIFKVPYILRRHSEKAYTPNAFSIGPWHRHHPLMKSTEKVKLKYLKGLLCRRSASITLKELIKSTGEIEKEARSCYAGPIDVGVGVFVRMLVIDGCFLIELFRKDRYNHLREDDDPIFNMSCMLQYLYHDLILVENQIPWLVLEHLFKMTAEPGNTTTLAQLALPFFRNIFPSNPPSKVPSNQGPKHLLDLLRNWLVLSSGEEKDGQIGWELIPSVTNLVDAGINLEVGESRSILDIKFENGVLEIPKLLVQETTEVIIRNLISYEQCSPKCTDRITSYAVLLDNLINTTKDMDTFTSSGIIDNWLNPDEATQFFNKLYQDAYLKKYYYLELCQDVNKYYRRRFPRWHALLMRNYFGTPWAIVSLFAAATLLILTIVQTIFTIVK